MPEITKLDSDTWNSGIAKRRRNPLEDVGIERN